MKEQEPNELTRGANSSNLEKEGKNFMAEGNNGGPEQPHRPEELGYEQESSHDVSSQNNPPSGGSQQSSMSEEDKARIKPKTESEIRQALHDQRVHEFAERVRKGEIDIDRAAEMYVEQFGDDEKRLQEETSQKREEKPPEEILRESFDAIQTADSFEAAMEAFRDIRAHTRFIYTDIEKTNLSIGDTNLTNEQKEKFKEWFKNAKEFFAKQDELFENKDLEGLKSAASELYAGGNLYLFSKEVQSQIKQRRAEGKGERKDDTQPQSLQALIGLIVASEDPRWSTGHELELVNENGEVQMHHFMEWVRSKIIYHHEFNADSKIDLFSQIYIATPYRQISLGEIIQESGRYFRNEVKDSETGVIRYEHSDKFQDFKDELLYEVWLFSKNHNYEVDYRLNMGNEEKAIEMLLAIHFENIFSLNKERLFRIMTMPAATKEGMDRALSKEREGGGVGKGFRQTELAYTYLYEIGEEYGVEGQFEGGKNMFEKVLGKEGSLAFYKGITEKLLRDKYGRELRETIMAYDKANKKKPLAEREDFLKYVLENNPDFLNIVNAGYDQNQNIMVDVSQISNIEQMRYLAHELLKKTYSAEKGIRDLNIFSQFANQRYKQDLLKAGMAHAIGQNYNLSEQDAKYAEHWAFSMTYWTGLSARNDKDITFFDSLSRLMNFNPRQLKEESGRSGGGDLEFMNGIQKMAFTMWEALRVTDEKTGQERTLLEVLQGGRGDAVNLDENIQAFNFSTGSQQTTLAAQHYSNAYNLYKFYMDENGFAFDEHLKRDNHSRLIVDPKLPKFVREKFLKGLRYAFDMGGYYYDREVRGWRKGNTLHETFVETKPTEKFMFSQKILDMKKPMYERTRIKAIKDAYRKDENGNLLFDENGDPVLKAMSRSIAAWTIAMELWKHRRWGSRYKIYTASEVNMIEEYLRSIPLEVEKTEMGAALKTPYFTEDEFAKIRQMGRVEEGKLQLESAAYVTFDSLKGALSEMLKKLLEKMA